MDYENIFLTEIGPITMTRSDGLWNVTNGRVSSTGKEVKEALENLVKEFRKLNEREA